MKNILIILTFILTSTQLTQASTLSGVIKINLNNNQTSSNESINQRINQLERAVIQLQQKVFGLQLENERLLQLNSDSNKQKEYTYYIKTPFDGTFYGTGTSHSEAKAKALQNCEKKSEPIFCNENNLKTDD
ncbi:MAG: hypothetical protein ACON35_03125 [Candidatus Marinamargulisbacteria bacterium]